MNQKNLEDGWYEFISYLGRDRRKISSVEDLRDMIAFEKLLEICQTSNELETIMEKICGWEAQLQNEIYFKKIFIRGRKIAKK